MLESLTDEQFKELFALLFVLTIIVAPCVVGLFEYAVQKISKSVAKLKKYKKRYWQIKKSMILYRYSKKTNKKIEKRLSIWQ